MANLEEFVCEAVDAVKFKLSKYNRALRPETTHCYICFSCSFLGLSVGDPADVNNSEIIFRPEMAHQIFGETENIFGYKDLNINVYYSAGPLDIYYDVKYEKKVWHCSLN